MTIQPVPRLDGPGLKIPNCPSATITSGTLVDRPNLHDLATVLVNQGHCLEADAFTLAFSSSTLASVLSGSARAFF